MTSEVRLALKKLAIEFGELLDDQGFPFGRLQELDCIAILAGASDWAAFKVDPLRYRGGPDCKQLRAAAVFEHLNRRPNVRAVPPATFLDVLGKLNLPVRWQRGISAET
ncbi:MULTISPECIES: hypothetical protein [unclassified Variovorax]|uniref:hypothetical protein n=1 Tax=unclassified Variovorax TaxID=663243 RepID=UPI001315F8CD|nr:MULTISPECIES: hypothetical protein [unclassified Variovorax]VTU42929.1 hypothetical protein SRS16P1_00394 [Variovorax sp. SRS16]VTU42960.1 hypothetical protein E5P1_00392 [Variovorax sp. PBL-E5]VTU43577.1 hypothetical protein H6P1_00512 [Variovorax sp. PBL-H6]